MSETICSYTQSKELHLFNIITLAEDKLQTNFARILTRLNNHQNSIKENKNLYDSLLQKLNNAVSNLQLRLHEENQHNNQRFELGNKQMIKLQNLLSKVSEKTVENQHSIGSMKKQQENMRLFLDSECQTRNKQNQNTSLKIRNIELELGSMGKLIEKKQNTVETNKIRQSLNDITYQIGKINDEQKFVQFKLDKFELNNQKHEKNQMTKQIAFMRDLQQKMKNQIKNSVSMIQKIPLSNLPSGSSDHNPPSPSLNILPISLNDKKLNNFTVETLKQNSIYNNNNIQLNQKAITRINQSLSGFERKIQICQNQLKQLSDIFESFIKQKKSNSTQLQQKINQIKPEFIKIWTKCDTIEDKNAFLERKVQQKNKQITHILQVLKQTQSSKFEDKLKMFQTQIFGKLQEERMKVQGKLSCIQFQKFSKNVLERIQMLNDQVIVKSDKIQVKKALLFLESKIKQIILVISEDQQQEKDALLTKKQIKCISCDKDIEKFAGSASNIKGNWDAFPLKQHSPDMLGRFGMTSYGSLSRKLKRLDCKQIPVFAKRSNKQSVHSQSRGGC